MSAPTMHFLFKELQSLAVHRLPICFSAVSARVMFPESLEQFELSKKQVKIALAHNVLMALREYLHILTKDTKACSAECACYAEKHNMSIRLGLYEVKTAERSMTVFLLAKFSLSYWFTQG